MCDVNKRYLQFENPFNVKVNNQKYVISAPKRTKMSYQMLNS